MTTTTVLDGCAVVTMDAQRSEHATGHVVVEGTRISAVAAGPAPRGLPDALYVEVTGCMATPGLVNTHHHRLLSRAGVTR
jgi:cytosine/adenosine deaminase-related metal-dependent hydrolase